MVRVLLCHYFKSQKVFSESYQPTSLCSTKEFLFVGIGGCKVFVYSLQQSNFSLVCQFSTISTAIKLICNDNSNYVATIERRQQKDAMKFSRVYFNWDKASLNEAVRVVVAGHSLFQRDNSYTSQFLAIELSSRGAVSAIASCKSTGNVILSTDGKLCLYRQCTLQRTPEVNLPGSQCSNGSEKTCDFEHLLDIEPGFVVRGVDICENFIGFRSKLEFRVVKLEFYNQSNSGGEITRNIGERDISCVEVTKALQSGSSKEVVDDNFVFWSFDCGSGSSKDSQTWVPNEHLFRTIRSESTYTDTFLDAKEIIGPVVDVKGHPIKVMLAGRFGIGISIPKDGFHVRAVTMLYRRFKAENLCNIDAGNASLHSLQLLPTYVKGLKPHHDAHLTPLLPTFDDNLSLCGMCILVSGPKEGYIYDIYKLPRLLSVYRYTRDTLKVSVCHMLLHAITSEGLETYTVRMFAAASECIRQDEAQRLINKHSEITCKTDCPDNSQSCSFSEEKTENKLEEKGSICSSQDGSVKDDQLEKSLSSLSLDSEKADNSLHEDQLSKSMSLVAGLGPLEQEPGDEPGEYLGSSHEADKVAMKQLTQADFKGARPREHPNLPVHELECLNKICPPSTLDICLIGMYPFAGPSYVMCSDDSVILFTRASRDSRQRTRDRVAVNSAQPEWSIYQLQNNDPAQLYKAVMPLANRCQKDNPQAFHRLVCEQHMILRSYCLYDMENEKEKKKIKKLLCESSANLGDLYARAEGEQSTYSSEYYDMSGLPFHEVVSRAWKLSGEGLAHYLDQKLLGSDEPVVVSEGIAKKIFKIYSCVNPSRVSEVILMSSLTGFSPETSISALEDLKKAETKEKTAYRFSALDNLVSAILYLNQCEPDHAQAALSSIQETEMIDTVVTNSFLLHDEYKHLTPLSQMLRKHKPAIFLAILLRLHDTKMWSLDTILTLLGANQPDALYNYQVSEFLEAVLNDKRRIESFAIAVDCLSNILLMRLTSSSKAGRTMASASHQHIPIGDGHFSTRHEWLNQLTPFSGSTPVPNPSCPVFGKNTGPSSPRMPRHLTRPSSRKIVPHGSPNHGHKVALGGYRENGSACSCCCCMEDLLKLQALLCSAFTSSDLCKSILSKLGNKDFSNDLSILVLCLPRVGKFKEATALLLEKCPGAMIPIGKLFFQSDVGMWSHLLEVLLRMFPLKTQDSDEETKTRKKLLLDVLDGTLSKLAQLTSPLQFVSLIPDEGALTFFVPYLQQSVRRCGADSLCNRLTTDTTEGSFHLY